MTRHFLARLIWENQMNRRFHRICSFIAIFAVIFGVSIIIRGCLGVVEPGQTDLIVDNMTGAPITVAVEYKTYGVYQFLINDREACIVAWDHVYGRDSKPRLREDIVSLTVTDEHNQVQILTRTEIMKKAVWEREGLRWILTLHPTDRSPDQ
jgi:hypothetical protein